MLGTTEVFSKATKPVRQYLKICAALLSMLLTGILLAGCATSDLASRKKERAASYASFPPETRDLVDQGQIKIGMPADAVYIAWGQPGEVLQSETEYGHETVWLYYGGWMQETRYWYYRRFTRDYEPRTYVRAEVVFVDGKVRSWRTLPQPVY